MIKALKPTATAVFQAALWHWAKWREPATSAIVAEKLGMSVQTARRHLEALAEEDRLIWTDAYIAVHSCGDSYDRKVMGYLPPSRLLAEALREKLEREIGSEAS